MPDVATAPTATAAQTRAAGSRMIGYYLGVGGVKVDVLFDTANFLTKNAGGSFEGVVPGGGTLFVEQAGSASVSATKSWTPLSRIVRVRRAGAAASVNTMSTSRRCATRTMASEANFEWSRAIRRLREIFIARSEEHTSELQSLMR